MTDGAPRLTALRAGPVIVSNTELLGACGLEGGAPLLPFSFLWPGRFLFFWLRLRRSQGYSFERVDKETLLATKHLLRAPSEQLLL